MPLEWFMNTFQSQGSTDLGYRPATVASIYHSYTYERSGVKADGPRGFKQTVQKTESERSLD